MKNFEIVLDSAIKRCNDEFVCDQAFQMGFSQLYPFTTENISGYIDSFDLKEKSLLTVGSSGDQVLNAIARCCKDITVLDINPYTKFYYYLKVAGIIELSKDEFLEFFKYKSYHKAFQDNNNVFNKKSYDKLKMTLRLLDYESYLFWDELINNYSGKKIRDRLFSMDEYTTKVIEKVNLYLDNYIFENLKSKLTHVFPNFVTGNIFQNEVSQLFDVIWLSNIGSYHLREKVKVMTDKFSNLLKNNGSLLISYLYQTVENSEYRQGWWPIYDLPRTLKLLEEYNPQFISFTGIKDLKYDIQISKDSILVYKKK